MCCCLLVGAALRVSFRHVVAQVYGKAMVYGDALVYGDAWVSGDAQVFGDVSTATESYAIIGGKKYRFVEVKA